MATREAARSGWALAHPLRGRHLGWINADSTRLFPNRTAVKDADREITYAELDQNADALAQTLTIRGVGKGDRVALLWENHIDYLHTLLGVLRAGAVAVPLNPKLGDDTIEYILDDANAVALLPSTGAAERALALASKERFVVTPDDITSSPIPFDFPDADANAVCMQPYTSGSTGRPKGVLLTHAGLIWNVKSFRWVMMVDETDKALVVIPMFHANAGLTVLAFLEAGGEVVVMPGFEPDAALRTLAAEHCTFLGGVPAIFRALVDAYRRSPRLDVGSLRLTMAGSAPMPPDLPSEFEEVFGLPLREGYGLTEGGPAVTLAPQWGVDRDGTVGYPIPGCEIRVMDENGNQVPAGQAGRLWVRNPGVTIGYHNLRELTRQRLRDGWLDTGDIARLDEDGFVSISGRADDMLNVGGENVYPTEVEQLLRRHPAVREVAVVALPHHEKGEVPAALVVLQPNSSVDEPTLKDFFIETGPAYAHPRRVAFVPSIPVSATGKIDRQAALEILEEKE